MAGRGGVATRAAIIDGVVAKMPMIFFLNVGEVAIEGVFREALSNRIDAILVDRTGGRCVVKAKQWSTWTDIEGTFNI